MGTGCRGQLEWIVNGWLQGEIFLGHTSSGYLIVPGFGPGFREQGFGFIMHTPDRAYQFSADTELERRDWIEAIDRILRTPLVPQDNNLAVSLNKKRHDSMAFFSRYMSTMTASQGPTTLFLSVLTDTSAIPFYTDNSPGSDR